MYTRSATNIEGANSPSRRMPRGYAAVIAELNAEAYRWRGATFGGLGGAGVGLGAGFLMRRKWGRVNPLAAMGAGALTGALLGSHRYGAGYNAAWRRIGYDPSTGYA